jgi:Fe-S-cluster containining protein
MPEKPFYSEGLRFSCTRCSACCRYEPGFVFLSENDAAFLAAELGLGYAAFVQTYCRWVPWFPLETKFSTETRSPAETRPPAAAWEGGLERLSLKEKSDNDCIFWKDGCLVYRARPVQCRTFPFWRSLLDSPESWEWAAGTCPGMGKGVLHSVEHIESCIARQAAETMIVRNAGGPG